MAKKDNDTAAEALAQVPETPGPNSDDLAARPATALEEALAQLEAERAARLAAEAQVQELQKTSSAVIEDLTEKNRTLVDAARGVAPAAPKTFSIVNAEGDPIEVHAGGEVFVIPPKVEVVLEPDATGAGVWVNGKLAKGFTALQFSSHVQTLTRGRSVNFSER